jgi:phosphate starvation-inducible protein PhoH and related proteins
MEIQQKSGFGYGKIPVFCHSKVIFIGKPLIEKVIHIDRVDPREVLGAGDSNLIHLKKIFPGIKIVARGDTIKVMGSTREIQEFETLFHRLIDFLDIYGKLAPDDIEAIRKDSGSEVKPQDFNKDDTLVFGNRGIIVKARTPNQRKMVESIARADMLFAVGPAGTGKTYTAVALAVRALKNKEVKKIVLTRPAVEAGENLGFLPGDLKEKLDPYLQPLYDALYDMVPPEKLETYLENRIVEIAPLAFMRGRTLDNAFVILDEAQNATQGQLKMFLTRMGPNAKFVITGDDTQVDLPRNQPSGLIPAIKKLTGINGIEFVFLDESDVIRHRLVREIITAYDKDDK